VLFAPNASEIYGRDSQTYVDVPAIGAILEGAVRPGYFKGVATVVTKLLNIVQPNRAYFGEKDYQQVALIRRMVEDLFLPVEIVAVPTVRDSDGVALSSQHAYLSEEQRAAVRRLPQALKMAEGLLRSGKTDAGELAATIRAYLAQEPLAQVDLVSVLDADTFKEVATLPARVLVLLFVRFGRAQLLDHIVVEI
jgi:pantoate--beta-alanine ligase